MAHSADTELEVPIALRRAVPARLLGWFARHRRRLPWRTRRAPYRVWVAELMLQQTRVEQVVPYYERFMRRFPTVRALASAPQRAVLKIWEGLGYYARARQLHRTAKIIVKQFKGRWPATSAEWRRLPGIGEYTAAAIASLTRGEHVPVVDGNVMRVLARLLGFTGDPRSVSGRALLRRAMATLLPHGRAGGFNEAMMELGALCCRPQNPHCLVCPLRQVCAAFKRGLVDRIPLKRPKRVRPHKVVGAGVIVGPRDRILIAQRKETSMLGGLWEFPGGTREPNESLEDCIARELREELGIETEIGAKIIVVRHAYSHFTIELHAHWAAIRRGRPQALHCAAWRWVPISGLRNYPFSAADLQIVNELEAHGLGAFHKWKQELSKKREQEARRKQFESQTRFQ